MVILLIGIVTGVPGGGQGTQTGGVYPGTTQIPGGMQIPGVTPGIQLPIGGTYPGGMVPGSQVPSGAGQGVATGRFMIALKIKNLIKCY